MTAPIALHPTQSPNHTWLYVRLVGVALLWGGTFIFGKKIAMALPPLTAAVGRFAIATVLLLIVAKLLEGGLPRLNRKQWIATALLGLTGIFLYNLFFFSALARLPAGRTALIIAMNPIVTALAMAVIAKERIKFTRWLGIGLALIGVSIVLTRGDVSAFNTHTVGLGEGLMFCGVCSWAAYTIIGKRALSGLSPIAATTYASAWGLLMLLIAWVTTEAAVVPWHQLDAAMLFNLFYMGAFGTVIGFIWYYQGVQTIGPARTAVFNNLVPVFGVLLSVVWLGEPLLASMVIGGLTVIAGVVLTNRG